MNEQPRESRRYPPVPADGKIPRWLINFAALHGMRVVFNPHSIPSWDLVNDFGCQAHIFANDTLEDLVELFP